MAAVTSPMFAGWAVSIVIGRTLCGHFDGECGPVCEREYGTETTDDTVFFTSQPTDEQVEDLAPLGWSLLECEARPVGSLVSA